LPKSGIVSEVNLEKMQKLVAKLPKEMTSPSSKQKPVDSKILKSDEIGF
jgi:hypothetical protein